MKRFIFGFDGSRPGECARELRERGIDAVVVGGADAQTLDALRKHGLGLYLCYGAHGLGGVSDACAHSALDAEGEPAAWFSSGCPNDEALIGVHLDAVMDRAREMEDVRGVFVDGARFASFASAEGPDGFFSCFCPRCMEKMNAMGLDAEGIRLSVRRLKRDRIVREGDFAFLRAWFSFRESCVKRYMERFAERVHAVRSDLKACAFVFAPSLAHFVGQTEAALGALDVVSPMLYRAYPHADGPACLGHEWAAALSMFGRNTLKVLAELAGAPAPVPDKSSDALLGSGFDPERIGFECELIGRRENVLPILQIEDDRLEESVGHALNAGADGVGFFMYGQAPTDGIPR